MDNCFPKSARILKSKDYQRVYEAGQRIAGQMLQLFYCSNQLNCSRFGISVSRRFGKAAQRNLLKRRIRESIRKNKVLWPRSRDVVVHPKASAQSRDSEQLASELRQLLKSLSSRKEIGIPKKSYTD